LKPWVEPDEARLRPQEAALLALCDRLTVLEQAYTAEVERHALTRKRLDFVQKELDATQARLARLEADHRAIFNALAQS
jgi:hypothetical protein